MINKTIMKTLIERFENLSTAAEANEFVNEFVESEHGAELKEVMDEAIEEDLLHVQISVATIMNAYLFAKVDELQDKVAELERQNAKDS